MNVFESVFYEIRKYLEDNYFDADVGDQYSYISFNGSTGTTLFSIMVGLCVGMLIASYFLVWQRNHMGRMVRRLRKMDAKSPKTAKSLEELGMEKDAAVKHALRTPSVLRKLLHIVAGDRILIRDLYISEITEEMVQKERDRDMDEKEKARLAAIAAAKEETELRREHAAVVTGEADLEEVIGVDGDADGTAESAKSAVDTANEEGAEAAKTAEQGSTLEEKKAQKALQRMPKFDVMTAKYYIPEELAFRAENRFGREKFGPVFLIAATVIFLGMGFLLVRFTPFLLGLLDRSLVALFG